MINATHKTYSQLLVAFNFTIIAQADLKWSKKDCFSFCFWTRESCLASTRRYWFYLIASFNERKTELHCSILEKNAEVISKLSRNSILTEETRQVKLVMALRVDKINMFARFLFRNQSLSGPSHNDPKNLAKKCFFLLKTLEGKKWSIHLCNKPVYNSKGDYFHKILISWLEKVKECGFDVVPIIFDGASTNKKVAKKFWNYSIISKIVNKFQHLNWNLKQGFNADYKHVS